MTQETENNWSFFKIEDDDNIYFEDGTVEPIKPHHFVLTFGKYKGEALHHVNDLGYLKWLLGISQEKEDWFMEKTVKMRLNELK